MSASRSRPSQTARGGADPVEDYLDTLFDELSGTGGDGRRVLAEAEDHLHSAREDLVAGGIEPAEASRRAVTRFGEADRLAGAVRVVRRDLGGLGRQLVSGGWLLGALGLLAIGLSGLLADLMGRWWGARFVAGDVNGVTYTAARCADFEGFHPGHSCSTAAALHHWDEIVGYRLEAGVLGLVLLLGYLLARRVGPLRGRRWRPDGAPVILVASVTAGLAAALLGGSSVLQLALGETAGTGELLSAGLVAGLVALGAAAYGVHARIREA